ncbi:MAG: DUF4416 domain-containing protein [Planctomycetota bacterium]|nr:MAG: DUF4416 domain-containing protein [Planctomycetota bacterium]
MGAITLPSPVLLVIAASSRYDDALDLGRQQCEDRFGPALAVSDAFDFTETDYYAAEMGPGLKKQLWAFDLIDPARLPAVKRQTNEWEAEYASLGRHPEPRPLNLDPGYITLAKLVLASTKDHAHRIYLSHGIYAEVTLAYRGGGWRPFGWTYPDYRRPDYQAFFTRCRELLRSRSR